MEITNTYATASEVLSTFTDEKQKRRFEKRKRSYILKMEKGYLVVYKSKCRHTYVTPIKDGKVGHIERRNAYFTVSEY